MINLLAPSAKNELRAARHNIVLRRYLLLMVFIIGAIGLVFATGYYITVRDKAVAEQERQEQTSNKGEYAKVQQTADAYAKNLSTAKTIIGAQSSASTFLTDLAATLPSGVILSQVALTADTAATNGPTTLRARAKDYNGALQLKQKLEDSPLFENVNIANVETADETQEESEGIVKAYPLDITINLKLSARTGATR